MKIAILGGSFNPPHLGHLILAEEVLACGLYDRILLIPSFIPPHKKAENDPGAGMRLSMLKAAVEGWPDIAIDCCEIDREGISYTIDTLSEISRRYPVEGKLGLVMGDDLAPDFLTVWKEPERILQLADVLVAHRIHAEELPLAYPHRYLDNLLIPISSSLVRKRIAGRGAWRALVPANVCKIIEDHGLYQLS